MSVSRRRFLTISAGTFGAAAATAAWQGWTPMALAAGAATGTVTTTPTFCEMFGDGRALFTSEESTVLVVDGLYDWSGFMSVSCDAVDAQGRARVPNAVFPALDPLAPFPGRTLGLSRFGL